MVIPTYKHINDGKVWKEFRTYNGQPFLDLPYNFCFILNVDWFQPYKKTVYSLGAMYIAVQNLPRNERYLSDNIIVPVRTMNSFLQPLVFDLLELWKGVRV